MDKQSEQIAKLLQGMVAGLLMKAQKESPLNIVNIDVPVDGNGDYKDYIEVTTFSGRKVHILFTSFDQGEKP